LRNLVEEWLMLALLGALREEVADLKRQMVLEEAFAGQGYHVYKGKYKNKDVLLVQTGLGRERAERATKLVLSRYPVTAVISIGFAGALTEESKIGDVILCSTLHCANGLIQKGLKPESYYCDTDLISRISQSLEGKAVRFRQGSSVTVSQLVSNPEAKQKLGKAFRANIVDMESYWVARIASDRQIPFAAVRAVSDTVQDSLPPLDRMLTPNGKWRWEKAAPYFIFHPQHLIKLFVLYRNARQARKSLTAFVSHMVAKL
jgi:adenosylhomocysteine nucleosidase